MLSKEHSPYAAWARSYRTMLCLSTNATESQVTLIFIGITGIWFNLVPGPEVDPVITGYDWIMAWVHGARPDVHPVAGFLP